MSGTVDKIQQFELLTRSYCNLARGFAARGEVQFARHNITAALNKLERKITEEVVRITDGQGP